MSNEEYEKVNGGVCAPKGFKAAGCNCGLNEDKSKNDLALVVCDRVCNAAAVYTTNKVKGAPITVTRQHLKASNGKAQAIVANSKNANTCNANGVEIADRVSQAVSDATGIDSNLVIVASTGVIGQPMSAEPFEKAMPGLVSKLSAQGHADAENAIMTTDTVPKEIAYRFSCGGKTVTIGAMGKGSGMIHPNMATTLNFIATDAAISSEMLQKALDDLIKITYNCLSVDGDTSTNDMVSIMADGLAGNPEITSDGPDYQAFRQGLYLVMSGIVRMLAKDGEGASKLIECTVNGAPDQDTAITVAKSVIGSNLLKCAIFGEDANWGRILCAIGYADAEFDIDKVDVDIRSSAGTVAVCRKGSGVEFSEEKAAEVLHNDEIYIDVNLNQGNAKATAWGCDLTYDYVKINGDYRS